MLSAIQTVTKTWPCDWFQVVDYPRHPSTASSALVELTTRLDFFKERRSQLMEQLHNLDLNYGTSLQDSVYRPSSPSWNWLAEKMLINRVGRRMSDALFFVYPLIMLHMVVSHVELSLIFLFHIQSSFFFLSSEDVKRNFRDKCSFWSVYWFFCLGFIVKDPVNKSCSVVSIGEVMLIEQ